MRDQGGTEDGVSTEPVGWNRPQISEAKQTI